MACETSLMMHHLRKDSARSKARAAKVAAAESRIAIGWSADDPPRFAVEQGRNTHQNHPTA